MLVEGKVALVTGAAKGIGKAIALALAEEGAKAVVVNYHGSKERAEETVAEIQSSGAEGIAYQCNVADAQATECGGCAGNGGHDQGSDQALWKTGYSGQ